MDALGNARLQCRGRPSHRRRWTSANPELPPAVRLFVITGFLGGLTTFSTFSAEAFSLITSGAFIRAGVHMASHLLLSLTGTWAGWTAVRSL